MAWWTRLVRIGSCGAVVAGTLTLGVWVTGASAGPPPPAVTSVSPSSGPTSGGTPITIAGTNLSSALSVTVGGVSLTPVTNTATAITGITPPGAAGPQDVVATTADGTSTKSAADQFTYNAPPVVTTVSPSSGVKAGGTEVTVNGTGFTGDSTVLFGSATAITTTVVSAGIIDAVSPPGAGTVDITVVNVNGTSATSAADHFNFVAGITSLSPSSGPTGGGTTVTINGTGFTGASQVWFGTATAITYNVVSDTQITATSPPDDSGTVVVNVVTAGGNSVNSGSDTYLYDSAATDTPVQMTVDNTSGLPADEVYVGVVGTGGCVSPPGLYDAPTSMPLTALSEVPGHANEYSFTVGLDATLGAGAQGITGGAMWISLEKPIAFTADGLPSADTSQYRYEEIELSYNDNPYDTVDFSQVDQFSFPVNLDLYGSGGQVIQSQDFAGNTCSIVGALKSAATAEGGNWSQIERTDQSGNFLRVISPSINANSASPPQGWPQLEPYADTLVNRTLTLQGLFSVAAGTPYYSENGWYNYTGTFTPGLPAGFTAYPGTAPYTLTLTGTIEGATTPGGAGSIPGPTLVVPLGSADTNATNQATDLNDLSTGAYNGNSFRQAVPPVPLPVGWPGPDSTTTYGGTTSGVEATTAPNDVVNSIYNILTAGLSYGYWGGKYPNNSASFWGAWDPPQSPGPTGQPAFAAARTANDPAGLLPYNLYSQVLFNYSSAYNSPYSDNFGSGGHPSPDIHLATGDNVVMTIPADGGIVGSGGTCAPTVSGVSPSWGPTAGGTTVTIDGTGFTGASSVKFGSNPGTGLTVDSDTQITVTSPGGTGTTDITVTTSGGTSPTSPSDQFTYGTAPTRPPSVTGISPASGPTGGGTPVTISGTGFLGATSVAFGATDATTVTVVSDTEIIATSPPGSGQVDIQVTTPGGTSTATAQTDKFTYVGAAPPTVTGVSPTGGGAGGGTAVTITGTGFTSAMSVAFGASNAESYTVVSDTQIAVSSPPGSGTVDVTVTGPAGTSATSPADQFTYGAAPSPAVSGVSPNSGLISGWTTVSITGSGFTGASAVDFGDVPASTYAVISDTQISATSPQVPAGTGTTDITVTTPGGTSATSPADQFTYVTPSPPTVTALGATSGAASGGTTFNISGTNFSTATAVYFGSVPATSFSITNDGVINVVSPPGSGQVDVTVVNPGGTSATSPDDVFTYAPVVTGVSPSSGPTSGGTSVTIEGTSFTGTNAVFFGTTLVTPVTVTSDTEIMATSPPGSGTTDITVSTPGGTSTTSPADQFTWGNGPTVTSVAPPSGPIGGGTPITITGTNLSSATSVTVGGAMLTPITDTSTAITGLTPPGAAGAQNVVVTTGQGTSNNGIFNYVPTPTVSSLSPQSGSASGGTSVVISGTSLSGAGAVKFGTVQASYTILSDTQISATSPPGSGTVDVTVTTANGTSATNAGDQFTYSGAPAPSVTGVNPSAGPETGGTSVTITGTSFTGATAVNFGSNLGTGLVVGSDTEITVTSPAGTGTTDITVTTSAGTSTTSPADEFTYVAAPTIGSVAPPSGPTTGGTSITITGTNLSSATSVTVGGATLTPVTDTSTAITGLTPPGTVGAQNVVVTTAGGASNDGTFTYVAAPTIGSVAPPSGPTTGGTSITITGTNLSSATSVTVGGATLTPVTDTSTAITGLTPPGTVGAQNVVVTTAGGASNDGTFTYVAAPTIGSVAPPSGPTTGGTSITITGTNLSSATSVTVGGATLTPVTDTSTAITGLTPPGTVGAQNVVVTTAGGASNDGTFTYVAAPTIGSVAPPSGPTTGGTSITITGTNLSSATSVTVGGATLTPVTDTSTAITGLTPPGTVGAQNVVVTTAGGASNDGTFTYVAAPTIGSVAPPSGPTTGGTSITITGTNLSSATSVTVGGATLTPVTDTSTAITGLTPPGTVGAQNVVVTTAGGASNDGTFTYVAAPTIGSVAPPSGPTTGGTSITITGTNLSSATSVTVGGATLTPVTDTSTAITGLTPPGTVGAQNVVVSTLGGTVTDTGGFTYSAVATTVNASVAPASTTFAGSVDYSATVIGSGGIPSGTVTFTVGSTPICVATLAAGTGSCSSTAAPVGADTVTATYSGDAMFAGSVGTTTLTVTAAAVPPSPGCSATAVGSATEPGGYWLAGANGAVYSCGDAPFFGSLVTLRITPTHPVVGIAPTPDDQGYWLVASDGGLFAFGDARFYGSMGGKHLNEPVVGMTATPQGGYFEVASDGGLFAFGPGATFHGSMGGKHLNEPVVGMAETAQGGYYEVASDGGIFSFGPGAVFLGSMGGKHLNKPVVGIAVDPTGGYYEVASDGGIFAFGAPFHGSTGCLALTQPIEAMIISPDSTTVGTGTACGFTAHQQPGGYQFVAGDGGVFSFGNAVFAGSLGGKGVSDIVGMANS